MHELSKGLQIAMTGPAADAALARCKEVLDHWQVAMPAVMPLVLDFGLDRFHEVGLIEFWIANEMEAGYCGKYLFVFAGQTCPRHQHQAKHETFFMVKGEIEMDFDGTKRHLSAGDVLPVPPGRLHRFTGIGPALLLELSSPCEIDDNYFADTEIPIGGNYKGKAR